MDLIKLDQGFGRQSVNRQSETTNPELKGALAAVETFYYAFNNRDLETFSKLWLRHELIQLNNPLGGMLRGIKPISEMYERIFHGQARVWVELTNIVLYTSTDMAIFAGREIGQFVVNGQILDLQIRTTRFFGYSKDDGRWVQIHHHGSIDEVDLLGRYQQAVK